jgi:hypothetical protein
MFRFSALVITASCLLGGHVSAATTVHHHACTNVNQVVATAKCVLERLQADEAEHAAACECMHFYEAIALTALNTLNTDDTHDEDHHTHQHEQVNDEEDYFQICIQCHDKCIANGDDECHMLCDATVCKPFNMADDAMGYDDYGSQLTECHDDCESSSCIWDGSGAIEEEEVNEEVGGSGDDLTEDEDDEEEKDHASAPGRERRMFEDEFALSTDVCYTCHVGCMDTLLKASAEGGLVGDAFEYNEGYADTATPLHDAWNEEMKCHDDCELAFPRTDEDVDHDVPSTTTTSSNEVTSTSSSTTREVITTTTTPEPEEPAATSGSGNAPNKRTASPRQRQRRRTRTQRRPNTVGKNAQCHLSCEATSHVDEDVVAAVENHVDTESDLLDSLGHSAALTMSPDTTAWWVAGVASAFVMMEVC